MYVDQHSIESTGTARLLARNAYAYEDYLAQIFGRRWVLAGPAKIKGTTRLRVKFAPDKAATGDGNGPFIILWVEYNPAMGLHTVWGEYWGKEDATEPDYRSSPRSGYDNEMLADPARIFDWLDVAVTMGEGVERALSAVAEGIGNMVTPAGNFVESELIENPDGTWMLQLEPEMRMPKEYFVSGTRFPGMTGPDELDYEAADLPNEWVDTYVEPVQSAVQMTLDTLYGVGVFKVEVDLDGYVVVSKQPLPPQNFGSWASDNLPTNSNLVARNMDATYTAPMESKQTWYADSILRMAGVGNHEKYADRKLDEAKKKSAPPFGPKGKADVAAANKLVKQLKARKKAGEKIRDPEALAGWIGLQAAGRKGGKAESREDAPEVSSNIAARMKTLLGK